MALIVQKFGGSSVANADRVRNVASIITDTYKAGNDVVVGSTDEVLDAGFVIDEDSPEDIMDVFGDMDADNEE